MTTHLLYLRKCFELLQIFFNEKTQYVRDFIILREIKIKERGGTEREREREIRTDQLLINRQIKLMVKPNGGKNKQKWNQFNLSILHLQFNIQVAENL